jgi:hypothetical protein
MREQSMNRREFIKCGGTGLAAIAIGQTVLPNLFGDTAHAAGGRVELTIVDAYKEMVDKTPLFHYAFSNQAFGPRVPGPVLMATEGDVIEVQITNHSFLSHAFSVPGYVESPPIRRNETVRFRFRAPPPGSYLYFDPLREPVNRVLGLHGALIVKPREGNTPYGVLPPDHNVQRLFNNLGRAEAGFPGLPWAPQGEYNRERVWIFSQADPKYNQLAEEEYTKRTLLIDPEDLRMNFLPSYFMINGRSGAFSSHDIFEDEILRGYGIAPADFVGRPHLIRLMNAGHFNAHSPHIHGNHWYLLSENGEPRRNVWLVDTYTVASLDRVDVLLPFIRPPCIPDVRELVTGDRTHLAELLREELETLPKIHKTSHVELSYPMHNHEEQSQTAAGGNYPQGAVAHGLVLLGDVDGVPFHHLVHPL